MREIKFRYVFENDEKEICSIEIITLKDLESGKYSWIHLPRQSLKVKTRDQFTGLLDKNGNEIYEGDILDEGYECYWLERDALFAFRKFNLFGAMTGREFCLKHEVIGNIYENSHMIESPNISKGESL